MEILAVLLAFSMMGNFASMYLFYRMAIKSPVNLLQKRRDEIAPFVSSATIRPADAVELNEVDEELVKASIKKTLSEGLNEPKDDEVPSFYDLDN
jgi:hypothetical protein